MGPSWPLAVLLLLGGGGPPEWLLIAVSIRLLFGGVDSLDMMAEGGAFGLRFFFLAGDSSK